MSVHNLSFAIVVIHRVRNNDKRTALEIVYIIKTLTSARSLLLYLEFTAVKLAVIKCCVADDIYALVCELVVAACSVLIDICYVDRLTVSGTNLALGTDYADIRRYRLRCVIACTKCCSSHT